MKKLYDLTYATEKIEQFAIESLAGVANEQGVDTDINLTSSKEPATEVIVDDFNSCQG
jgi:symplekin